MNVTEENIYRLKKYDWVPLLSFGGGVTRVTDADGWHEYPYGIPQIRTLGVRWKNTGGTVEKYDVAYRRDGTYSTHETSAGYTCEVKYAPEKIDAIWYRYRNVDAILQPLSSMINLKVLSFREHMINFGDCDLSQCSKFSHFEISKGGSINTVTFHVDAPLKFAYLDSGYPQQVKDACLTQAYNHRDTFVDTNYGDRLIGVAGYSTSLQYMADELVNNYGWSIS